MVGFKPDEIAEGFHCVLSDKATGQVGQAGPAGLTGCVWFFPCFQEKQEKHHWPPRWRGMTDRILSTLWSASGREGHD